MTIPETTEQELRRLLRQVNRKSLLNSRTKLFCATCESLQQVIDAFGNYECKLACGHRREIEPGIAQRIAALEREVREIETSSLEIERGGQ
jgi:hypothetical protein